METYIWVQAAEIAASLALGMILGFVYDLLRLPRKVFRGLGVLIDLGFCLTMAAGLFLLGMSCGGTLRYYMPFAAAGGAAVYSAIFGRWLRPLLHRGELVLVKMRERAKNKLKICNKNLKNIFSRVKKRFTITKYTNGKVGRNVSKSGARRARRRGEHEEISTGGHSGKNYYPGGTDLRAFYDG